jgi:hypothetical protein
VFSCEDGDNVVVVDPETKPIVIPLTRLVGAMVAEVLVSGAPIVDVFTALIASMLMLEIILGVGMTLTFVNPKGVKVLVTLSRGWPNDLVEGMLGGVNVRVPGATIGDPIDAELAILVGAMATTPA